MSGKRKRVSDLIDPDHEPVVGTDPHSLSQPGKEKVIIAPDPEKVREAERKRKRETGNSKPE